MASKESIKPASVLAFEKKLVPSDGRFYGMIWEDRNDPPVIPTALKLQEKSVRGTISNRLKKALQDDSAKLDAEVEKPNLQTVDSCALGCDQDTLKMSFTLKILSGVEKPSACNSNEFEASYRKAAKSYIEGEGFSELAKRYATNIANARFLWRNRVGADCIEVTVKVLNQDEDLSWTFNAQDKEIGIKNFTNNHPNVAALAVKIADALSGKREFLLLEINAYAQIGLAQDVYPSEELILDKGSSKSKKSKILYHIDGIAGMHSQKIGNALRTIDTWYPQPEDGGIGPIAIEVYGAVTNLGKAYRSPKDKADFYTLFDRFVRGGALSTDEQHYVMAVLVRGGVFGESGKE